MTSVQVFKAFRKKMLLAFSGLDRKTLLLPFLTLRVWSWRMHYPPKRQNCSNRLYYVRFEVSMAVTMKNDVFSNIKSHLRLEVFTAVTMKNGAILHASYKNSVNTLLLCYQTPAG
jgi:hypothetical protein